MSSESDGGPLWSPSPSASSSSPAGPPARRTARAAKEVVVALAAEPRSLLPNTIVDWTTNNQLEHMYDRLVDRDAKSYKPAPMLATELEDRQRHHLGVHARQGVKFHNGEPFNAAVRQGDHGLHHGSRQQDPLRAALGAGEGGPDRQRLHRALHHQEAVAGPHRPHGRHRLPPHAAQGAQGAGRGQSWPPSPSAPGRSSSSQWVRDEQLVLERNPDYWQGPADVSRVTFRFIPEFSARLAALLAGEIDIMKDVPPAQCRRRWTRAARPRCAPPCPRASTTWRW